MKSAMLAMALIFCFELFCAGQNGASGPAPAAPIPVQIGNAKTVFISNEEGEELDPRIYFLKSFDWDRPYNQFFAAIEAGGRFKPVLVPADADLILEVRLRAVPSLPAAPQPELRLVIVDPKTRAVLWAFTETIKREGGPHWEQKIEKNFNDAMTALVGDLTRLAGAGATVGADSRK